MTTHASPPSSAVSPGDPSWTSLSVPESHPAVVVGAHGGCGTTTVAAHLRGSHEVDLEEAASSTTGRCFVVAAATADGTSLAVRAIHRLELAGYPCDQLHLVLVRDGRGPLPVSARARLRLLSSVVGGVTVLPHVQRWRYERSEQRSRSRRYDSAVARLERAVAPSVPAPARGGRR